MNKDILEYILWNSVLIFVGRICMNAREYLDILHVAERLKDTPRHCTTTKRRKKGIHHRWTLTTHIAPKSFFSYNEISDLRTDG